MFRILRRAVEEGDRFRGQSRRERHHPRGEDAQRGLVGLADHQQVRPRLCAEDGGGGILDGNGITEPNGRGCGPLWGGRGKKFVEQSVALDHRRHRPFEHERGGASRGTIPQFGDDLLAVAFVQPHHLKRVVPFE